MENRVIASGDINNSRHYEIDGITGTVHVMVTSHATETEQWIRSVRLLPRTRIFNLGVHWNWKARKASVLVIGAANFVLIFNIHEAVEFPVLLRDFLSNERFVCLRVQRKLLRLYNTRFRIVVPEEHVLDLRVADGVGYRNRLGIIMWYLVYPGFLALVHGDWNQVQLHPNLIVMAVAFVSLGEFHMVV